MIMLLFFSLLHAPFYMDPSATSRIWGWKVRTPPLCSILLFVKSFYRSFIARITSHKSAINFSGARSTCSLCYRITSQSAVTPHCLKFIFSFLVHLFGHFMRVLSLLFSRPCIWTLCVFQFHPVEDREHTMTFGILGIRLHALQPVSAQWRHYMWLFVVPVWSRYPVESQRSLFGFLIDTHNESFLLSNSHCGYKST